MALKRESAGDKAFSVSTIVILILCCLSVLYPLYYMLIVSVSDGMAVMRGDVNLFPVGINLDAYKYVFSDQNILRSYFNTIEYTVVGTVVNLVMTALCAYPLSRKKLYGRSFFTLLIVITMFFDAGMVADFMVVNAVGLRNTMWALVIPSAISVWNMVIMRTFFADIPEELHESAYIDGANDMTIFVRIILPLSKSVMATMVLFYAVAHWNSFFPALIYLDDRTKYPMQLILRNIVLGSDATASAGMTVSNDAASMGMNIRYAVIFVAVLPILLVYPFVQKYFMKGVMVGSLKG